MGLFDIGTYIPGAEYMTPEQRRNASTAGWLNAAANMFESAAPRPGPSGGFGQAFASGLRGFQGGADQYAQQLPQQYKAMQDMQQSQAMNDFMGSHPDLPQKFGLPAGMPITGNTLQDLAKHYVTAQPTMNGGATGAIAQKLMQDNPGMTFTQALQLYQTGMRQGVTLDENGNAVAMPGYGQAKGLNKFYEESGGERAKLGYAGDIAQATGMGKNAADLQMMQSKNVVNANNAQTLLGEARNLLPKATGSGIGSIINAGKGFVGVSDEQTQANAGLEAIGARLVIQMPRMEGPQSDKDTALYKAMAGKIGDSSIPIGDRLAAIDVIESLNAKYLNKGTQAPPGANEIGDAAQSMMPAGIQIDELPGGYKVTPKGTKYKVIE